MRLASYFSLYVSMFSSSRCLAAIESLTPENEDQKKGIAIVKYALTRPLYTIADNAGLDASVIVNQVTQCGNVNEGFDAANEKMVDMISAGIIDPAKVVRTALTDAAGVASLLCTAEVSWYIFDATAYFDLCCCINWALWSCYM